MQKPIKTFRIAEYVVLVFEELPRNFSKIKFNDTICEVTIPYDIPNSIAIKTNENLNNTAVEFI